MTKIGEEINDLLAEIVAENAWGDLEPGDVTIASVSSALGVCESRARSILDTRVREGTLIKVRVKHNGGGGFINAYRRP